MDIQRTNADSSYRYLGSCKCPGVGTEREFCEPNQLFSIGFAILVKYLAGQGSREG